MTISHAVRSHVLTNVVGAVFLAGGLMAGIGTASSQDAKQWNVDGKIHGEPRKSGGGPKKSKDVSGLACAPTDFPKVCIIVDDETQGAQVVILKDGELVAGEFIPLINEKFEDDVLELDAEGVAYADNAFYVIGSHGRRRDEKSDNKEVEAKDKAKNDARAEATRRVFRIGLSPASVDTKTGKIIKTAPPEIKGSAALGRIIEAQDDLRPWFNKPLEQNGLTIEGVAARNGKLYVGMRGPVLPDGNAVILEVPIPAVFDRQPDKATPHKLNLGKDTSGNLRGVRDLVPYRGGFLVLAGPVNDPPKGYEIQEGDYTIFYWSGNGPKLEGHFDLKGYGKEVKPEAIVPLEETDRTFRTLILFDGPKQGMPTPITIDLTARIRE